MFVFFSVFNGFMILFILSSLKLRLFRLPYNGSLIYRGNGLGLSSEERERPGYEVYDTPSFSFTYSQVVVVEEEETAGSRKITLCI